MKLSSVTAFLAGILVAALAVRFMFPMAFAEEPVIERIPVLQMGLDGNVTLGIMKLAQLPPPWQNYICIREFDSKGIRCYALNGTTAEVLTFDLTLTK